MTSSHPVFSISSNDDTVPKQFAPSTLKSVRGLEFQYCKLIDSHDFLVDRGVRTWPTKASQIRPTRGSFNCPTTSDYTFRVSGPGNSSSDCHYQFSCKFDSNLPLADNKRTVLSCKTGCFQKTKYVKLTSRSYVKST
jgi:hypothetical protein